MQNRIGRKTQGKTVPLQNCSTGKTHNTGNKSMPACTKQLFGGVQQLKAQQKEIGEVAVLQRDERYIYDLITKERYFHKPTYGHLTSSLHATVCVHMLN